MFFIKHPIGCFMNARCELNNLLKLVGRALPAQLVLDALVTKIVET